MGWYARNRNTRKVYGIFSDEYKADMLANPATRNTFDWIPAKPEPTAVPEAIANVVKTVKAKKEEE